MKKAVKRRHKAKVLFKAKPLTRAQKLKPLKVRQALTKQMRQSDPFYIHPDDVPAGKAYQWFSMTILGTLAEIGDEFALENGWKYVPYSRHDFPRKNRAQGRIIVNNCVLMECQSKRVTDLRHQEYRKAREQMAEVEAIFKKEGRSFPIVSDSFVVSSKYDYVQLDAPSVIVPITLSFSMDARWQDAASGLGLTNDEYARRRIVMTTPILAAEYSADDVKSDRVVYHAVTLKVEK